jgi:murein DD-endopeptidase MepM/ murein hydrolase activator NlpD
MKPPLGHKIDQYLNKRGSPMAGQGATFVRAGKRYGIDPRLLVGIATIESGAGAHTKLQFNPFNWGVHRGQTYGSYEESIMDVARGLKRGYIDEGLTTPQQIVSKYAPASDNNDEGNWASVVSQVMSAVGGAPATPYRGAPAQATRTSVTQAPMTPQRVPTTPMFDPAIFKQAFQQRILSGGRLRGSELSDLITSSFAVPSPPPAAPGATSSPEGHTHAPGAAPHEGEGLPMEMKGKTMVLPTKWKTTHPTSGLEDQGFIHAQDIMGHPGTPVGAPEGGTIIRHGSAQGGSSIYFQADSGRVYWIGHIESNFPVGKRVKRGQVIAQISSDHAAPHVHLDYSTSYKP